MRDHTEREREARERLTEIAINAGMRYMGERARFAEQLVAYRAAVRAAVLAEVRAKVEAMDGVMEHGDALSRFELLTQLEATDGR